ncbi:TetR/AcrR family transcriptional regulator [Isoptericola cucumis]|uniref:Transcriptional regulator, TetR family protein n=1 Tax=Isoptericola cucumis TaxID=1776856 RepID=A0ABQ2BCF1_9MICO|nr:TetR/AcrR family transcriptional regulator [Isoptericola cucumis]GGI10831.1 putative transcriptional regulator, TetR family protein [Isoptericola cucumis]
MSAATPSNHPPLLAEAPAGADTRTRIRHAAARLFARRGYAGTGLKQVATDAAAPFGSIYHFFPGGKDALAEDMIRTTGPQFMALVLGLLEERADPVEAVVHAFDSAAEELVADSYADGCPVATMALDVADTNEPLRRAAADVFAEWLDGGTAWFSRHVARDRARDLALAMIMLTEGAFLLGRTTRDPGPLRAAGRTMGTLVQSALDATPRGPRSR